MLMHAMSGGTGHQRSTGPFLPADARAPGISIVIPTYSRPRQLRECLDAIRRLRYDRARFEVIVVDDGSPEPLDHVIAGVAGELAVTLVRQARAGPGAARNRGAALARGEYLAFLDDDCTPEPDWLERLACELRRDGRRLLGGGVANGLDGNVYSTASHCIAQFVYDYTRGPGAHERFFTANNVALRTTLFRQLGGFLISIPGATAEDKEFCDRWQMAGLQLTHVPDAVVSHRHHLAFHSFLHQHFKYGRGILAFRLLRRRRARQASLVPEPWRFYARLVMSPVHMLSGAQRWRTTVLVAVAQVATMAGAAYQALRWRTNRRMVPVRPATSTVGGGGTRRRSAGSDLSRQSTAVAPVRRRIKDARSSAT